MRFIFWITCMVNFLTFCKIGECFRPEFMRCWCNGVGSNPYLFMLWTSDQWICITMKDGHGSKRFTNWMLTFNHVFRLVLPLRENWCPVLITETWISFFKFSVLDTSGKESHTSGNNSILGGRSLDSQVTSRSANQMSNPLLSRTKTLDWRLQLMWFGNF